MIEFAKAAYGKVDILVNVAGTGQRHSFLEATLKFDRVMKVNLYGTFYCTQAAGREMVKNNYGQIINMPQSPAFVPVQVVPLTAPRRP